MPTVLDDTIAPTTYVTSGIDRRTPPPTWRLVMLSGEEVLRSVSTYAPATVSAAQVAHDDCMGALLDAGAHAVWARRVPPQDVALQLAQLVGV